MVFTFGPWPRMCSGFQLFTLFHLMLCMFVITNIITMSFVERQHAAGRMNAEPSHLPSALFHLQITKISPNIKSNRHVTCINREFTQKLHSKTKIAAHALIVCNGKSGSERVAVICFDYASFFADYFYVYRRRAKTWRKANDQQSVGLAKFLH